MKKILTITGLALALTLAGTAFAGGDRPHRMGHGGMGHHFMQRAFSQLDLSDAQQEQVQTIMSNFRDQMKSKAADRASFKTQMKALVHTASFDEAAVRALIESKQAQRLEAGVAMAKMRNQVWNVLTAQQQQKLSELMDNAGQRGQRMMHRMFEAPPAEDGE